MSTGSSKYSPKRAFKAISLANGGFYDRKAAGPISTKATGQYPLRFAVMTALKQTVARLLAASRLSGVATEQVAGVGFVFDVGDVVANAVSDDEVGSGFEDGQVGDNFGAKEVVRFENGFVDDDRNTLGFNAFHDALDGGRAKVIGAGFHDQAVDTDGFRRLRGRACRFVHQALDDSIGNTVFPGSVGLYNGLDDVVGNLIVIGE